ncbi:MAG: hypothetical protein HY898_23980 [Deltaproteobacteria bacterium]|nr:hypothetical protein [Deltaproteobacteria bacterium]
MGSQTHFRCCSACCRHIRIHEEVCPFCHKRVERVGALPVALGIGAVALAFSAAGCDKGGGSHGDSPQVSVYGPPPAPAADAGPPRDASPAPLEVYGPPPMMDAGPRPR